MTGYFVYLSLLLYMSIGKFTHASEPLRKAAFHSQAVRIEKIHSITLSIRGGAGLLDPKTLSEVAIWVSISKGSAFTLSPKATYERLYNFLPRSPMVDLFLRRVGSNYLAFGIAALCLVIKGTSLNTAIGYSTLPYTLEVVKCLLDQEPKDLGFAAIGQAFILVTNALVIYATLSNVSYADTVTKVYVVWLLLNGVFMALFPKAALNTWEFKDQSAPNTFMTRVHGFYTLGFGAMVTALAFLENMDTMRSTWLYWAAVVFGNIVMMLHVAKEFR